MSFDEHQRLAQMRPEVRHERARSRVALRLILGERLRVAPGEITFAYGHRGKPRLAAIHESTLTFSVSHSGGWIAIAVAESGLLGIDIERVSHDIEYELVAERVLSPREIEVLHGLGEGARVPEFYRAWVMKESLVKALGQGLFRNMADVEVLTSDRWVGRRWQPPAEWNSTIWSVLEVDGPEGLACAVAIDAGEAELRSSALRATLPGFHTR